MKEPLKGVQLFLNSIPIGVALENSIEAKTPPLAFEGELSLEDMTVFANFNDGDVINVTAEFGRYRLRSTRKCRVNKSHDGSVTFRTVD